MTRWLLRTAGYALAAGALDLSVAFGGRPTRLAAIAVATALGVVLAVQAAYRRSERVYRDGFGGTTLGAGLGLVVGALPAVVYFGAPVDYALWIVGIDLMVAWFGVRAALLVGLFVGAFAETF